jgi:hypothetical protein
MDYIEYYNNKRFHQGIGHKTPAQLYLEKKVHEHNFLMICLEI